MSAPAQAPAGAVRDSHGRLHAAKTHDVTVVGSVNADLAIALPHLPPAGQTVRGGDAVRGLGGKGANQAVAAARLGRTTALVAAVGDDADGRALRTALAAEGVDVDHVGAVDAPTGVAVVLVHDAESTIVLGPGANDRLDAARVESAAALVSGARVVLLQCEVPDEALLAAARLCTGLLVLNPAPARPLPPELLRRADLLVPNAGELAVLAGAEPAADVEALVRRARAVRPDGTTIVTRGALGCVVVTPAGVAEVPAASADAVDATAAGDSFVAGVVDALLSGAGLVDAARWAARVAAVTVSRPGAAASLPHREDVERIGEVAR
ncbi:ribokinase [Paenibacillus sp. TRM 82003]|uniref:ribokinase n=1 Tax=Kineococcus sp. TRM81007 TaxID=2925831 RepID=UPI001F58E0FC|nr:ribokinase [Kineococcus sp. TRM81007]MCI2238521.1 ribokinase [Kineococcus sp. TRM81007]MCI3921966.1 ribokinase [Paenibacillus sp. TRM 82003]